MGIKLKNPYVISKSINDFKERVEQAIINRLIRIGETFVRNARENGNYLDQTGNLRSSIGYIVLKDGENIFENFQSSSKGTDKTTGLSEGKNLAKKVASKLVKGFVLIGVAGMNYAAAVESKGRDVITASSIQAKNDLEKAILELKRKIK